MWNDIPAIVKALAAAVPVVLAVMRYLRPRRIVGLFPTVIERETLKQMVFDHEERAQHLSDNRDWWKREAEECQSRLSRAAQCRD